MMIGFPHHFQRAMPVLVVADMARSLAFYREKLGFSATVWGEPPNFAIVQRGTLTLALSLMPERKMVSTGAWSAYLYVSDADKAHTEFIAQGVHIADQPENRFYGCRDFVIVDPDGHKIVIGQDLDAYRLGPGLSDRVGRDAPHAAASATG
jgi:catechol 2,3-dioxygenase-like lactoylglutathione lyase family enzyme